MSTNSDMMGASVSGLRDFLSSGSSTRSLRNRSIDFSGDVGIGWFQRYRNLSPDKIPKEVAAKPSRKVSAPSAATGEPIYAQIGGNTFTLRCGKPADGGGASVDEYKIEQRRPDKREWAEVGLSPTTTRNKVDYGEYSTMSSPIKTFAAGSKPLHKVTSEPVFCVEESEAFQTHAVYEGRSEPSVKRYHNGAEIVEANNVAVPFGEGGGDSTLLLSKCKAGVHDGVYSCHIGNEAGYAVEETALNVSSKKRSPP